MENRIEEESIGHFVENSAATYGMHVNTSRQLPLVYDGLKPVYRRVIYAAFTLKNMTKTATVVGETMGKYHAVGDASIGPVVSNLVNYKILVGQGGHGAKTLLGEKIEPAAVRYSEAGISPTYHKILSNLMGYVPMQPTEVNFMEPQYIPTPIPMCLLFGLLGIGHGANTRIPAFTAKSLYEALQKDDPNLLEAPFGLEIVKDKSELQSLWNTGMGKVTYTFKVERGHSADGPGVYIKGSPELFFPNLTKINKWVDDAKLYVRDESDDVHGDRLFIGRNSNIKSINYYKIYELAVEASINTKSYRLNVTDGDQIYIIPLKTWLKQTRDRYIDMIKKFKDDNLNKENFNLKVYKNLPEVGKLILQNPDISKEDISSQLSLEMEVIDSILQKSINTLRKGDHTARLEAIEKKLEEYKSIDFNDWILNVINEF